MSVWSAKNSTQSRALQVLAKDESVSHLLHKMAADYHPPWYLRSATLQTILGSLREKPLLDDWQLYDMPLGDDDFHEIALRGPASAPLLCLVPGMGGNWRSASIQHGVPELLGRNWQIAVIHQRGFGRRINQLLQSTHAGSYSDLAVAIEQLSLLRPGVPLYAIGFSLGASQLMHYMAEAPDSPLLAAAAIATPFKLQVAQQCIPKFYQRYILKELKQHYLQKIAAGMPVPLTADEIKRLHTFRQSDTALTAPIHGYADVDSYYDSCSCFDKLQSIQQSVLLMNALDDPFYRPCELPQLDDLGPKMALLALKYGGHLGFWTRPSNGGALYPYWVKVVDSFLKRKT